MKFLSEMKFYFKNKIKFALLGKPKLEQFTDTICAGTQDGKAVMIYIKYCYLNMYRDKPATIMGHVMEVDNDSTASDLSNVALQSYPISNFVIINPITTHTEFYDVQEYKDLEVLREVQRERMLRAQERK